MIKEFHTEVVKELINIGVGKGADVLNNMVNTHVELMVPQIKFFNSDEYEDFINLYEDNEYSIITLPFTGEIKGFSKLIMSSEHASKLVDAFFGKQGVNIEMDSLRVDILSEIGNIITNAVMGTLSNILTLKLDYIIPEYIKGEKKSIIPRDLISSESVLLYAQTQFKIKEFETIGNFAIFFNLKGFEVFIEKIELYLNKNI